MFFLCMENNQTVFSGSSTFPKRKASCYIPRNTAPQYAGTGNHHLQKKVEVHPSSRENDVSNSGDFFQRAIYFKSLLKK